jgi:hypothetical protein
MRNRLVVWWRSKSIQVLARIEMLGERHGLISILRLKAQRHLARLAN